jgi:hypothetical protein
MAWRRMSLRGDVPAESGVAGRVPGGTVPERICGLPLSDRGGPIGVPAQSRQEGLSESERRLQNPQAVQQAARPRR